MRKTLFLFALFFSPFVIAQTAKDTLVSVAPSASVPVVSIDTFQPHHAWSWAYYTKDKVFYSSERYEVISVQGTVVTIEMATKFKELDPYKFHHRLVVDVQKCRDAYKNANTKKPWSFEMYNWTGKSWNNVGTPTNAAFEEKFNCNPHIFKTTSKQTLFSISEPEVGSQNIFQQKNSGRSDATWYFLDGPNKGIAAQRFAGLSEKDYGYLMAFLEFTYVTEATAAFQ
jgi:hypothetical protein